MGGRSTKDRRVRIGVLAAAVVTVLAGCVPGPSTPTSTTTTTTTTPPSHPTELLSVSSGGVPADGGTTFTSPLSVSDDGRYVVFQSDATNLVPGDDNDGTDIFVRDRMAHTTTLVSATPDGTPGNRESRFPSISGDGRFVAFDSAASDLVGDDTNATFDVFVRDLSTGSTEMVSRRSDGGAADDMSSTVGVVALSDDGRLVTFNSFAALVPDDTNGLRDVYVRDRTAGMIRRVSVDSAGLELASDAVASTISGDGSAVAFETEAPIDPSDTNGVGDAYLADLQTGEVELLSVAPDGGSFNFLSESVSLSDDASMASFGSYTAGVAGDAGADVFVRDRQIDRTERVSIDPTGASAGDFSASATGLSDDGTRVVFTGLVSGAPSSRASFSTATRSNQVYVRDLTERSTQVLSTGTDGADGDADSFMPGISGDGSLVAFWSDASDLVPADTNGARDLFARVVGTFAAGGDSTPPNLVLPADITTPATGPDGATVDFDATASDVVDGPLAPACTPASDSVFAPGTTTVQCVVSDAAGNTTTGEFAVTVTAAAPVVTAISAGLQHTCALIQGGTVRCWGSNAVGQLGDGTTTDSATPVTVVGITDAVSISAGQTHTCAVLGDGTVRCWGQNGSYGLLGNGSETDSATPVAVDGLTGVVDITTSPFHSCALLGDGTARCWGSNGDGVLGTGNRVSSRVPVPVVGLAGAVDITSGAGHTCALLGDGTARCWGDNVDQMLGNAAAGEFSTLPVAVVGLSGATSISAGFGFTCAPLQDDSTRCWGQNLIGQLGNAEAPDVSATPVVVSGLVGATSVVGGFGHACARLQDGTVECWGDNGSGQVGNGSTAQSAPRQQVGGLGAVQAVTAGSWHSCALISDGTVRCWGANGAGQLGNGTTIGSTTPVPVSGLS